jgi:hypothetical protein
MIYAPSLYLLRCHSLLKGTFVVAMSRPLPCAPWLQTVLPSMVSSLNR